MNLKKLQIAFVILFGICLIAFMNISGCNSNDSQGDIFPEPEVRKSQNGTLSTIIETLISVNFVENITTGEMDTVETATYEGGLIGPTLSVKPGDTIEFDLINNLPANPEDTRTGTSGAFPHKRFTTNFHTHGLTVSPLGISDNVLRRMEPGTTNSVQIEIPDDHACGTFWYHPHKHGAVSFQFFGGMIGFLIIDDEDCGLKQIPEIAAAKEVVMGISAIRTDETGQVPFVNPEAIAFSQNAEMGVTIPSLWQFFQDTNLYMTVNGVVNPTLRMKPGEVQRWRILNAASGITLVPALEGHSFNIVAQDGLNTSEVIVLDSGEGAVMGAGNRLDVMVKAGEPGTYLLQALDPTDDRSVSNISDVEPAPRRARIGRDFPGPTYPLTLATIVISGEPANMELPSGSLPAPRGLPSMNEMLNADLANERDLSMELCAPGTQDTLNEKVNGVCEYYFDIYDDDYWGGEFLHLMMIRDDNDMGTANPDPDGPSFIFQKEGLFTSGSPLFVGDEAMVTNTFERWTIYNRTNSDHPFHIHQNPYLVTHVNGVELDQPEWRDTMLIPAADTSNGGNIVDNQGSISYITYFNPITFGDFVMHCHILTHEDIGMMQQLRIVPE
ncbi:MAG: multicopper oxidase family protein [Thermodesulfobacteriota bacterium]